MNRRRAYFFRIGEFSLINDAVATGLEEQFPELDWRMVDVEKDIVGSDAILHLRASIAAVARYGVRIVSHRQPPRDFFPRLELVLRAVQNWVLTHVNPSETAFVFQTQSLFDARHPDLPHFVYTDHTYLANRRYPQASRSLPVSAAWRSMERELYRRARCTFVSSRFAAESLREDYAVPDDRVEVVFSGSNVSLPPEGHPGGEGRIILFVGVDWERKGGPELLSAFHEVRAKMSEAELWIVGCSPSVNEPGVRILGRLSREEVARCYREADIFCLPSRMDPSASVLAEAASYGLPVVATPVGGNPERVENGVTGFLCAPAELADRLLRLIRSPDLRREFGEAGRRLVSERFTWSSVCGRMASRMRKETER